MGCDLRSVCFSQQWVPEPSGAALVGTGSTIKECLRVAALWPHCIRE